MPETLSGAGDGSDAAVARGKLFTTGGKVIATGGTLAGDVLGGNTLGGGGVLGEGAGGLIVDSDESGVLRRGVGTGRATSLMSFASITRLVTRAKARSTSSSVTSDRPGE
jgi:hypothetical protein